MVSHDLISGEALDFPHLFLNEPRWQILLITSLCLVPSAVAWIDDTRFNYNVNACGTDRVSRVVGVLMNMVGLLVGVFLW